MSTMLAIEAYQGIQRAVVSLLAVAVMGTLANAAPVDWKFEATIVQIDGDVALQSLPFSLAPGQKFFGRYTFDSEGDLLDILEWPVLGEQGTLVLTIDGVEMLAATNSGTLNGGGFVNINGPPPLPGPVSSIQLGYDSLTNVFPGWGGHASGSYFGAGLALVGDAGLITSPDDVLDLNVLNELTRQRQLLFSFGRFLASEFEVVGVVAEVGDFVSVPEPSSAWLAWAVSAISLRSLVSANRIRRRN